MSGSDSDLWSTAGIAGTQVRSWDWQSLTSCPGLTGPTNNNGDDDDRLLGLVSRYTVENLILNAAHEIGEWLRFDARRVFPAHTAGSDGDAAVGAGGQGNGCVRLMVGFGAAPGVPSSSPPSGDDGALRELSSRIGAVAAAWRFTYLPGVIISYGPGGPEVTDTNPPPQVPAHSSSEWSMSTIALANGKTEDLVEAVVRDVHRLLMRHETDRICGAFHVDGRQAWLQAQRGPPQPDSSRRRQGPCAGQIEVTVAYSTEEEGHRHGRQDAQGTAEPEA